MKPGDRVLAFHKLDWIFAGRPEDKEPFWLPATILYTNPHHPENVTITWEGRGPKNTSHNHRLSDLRAIAL